MFITMKRSGYDRSGQQVASGLFLILMQPGSFETHKNCKYLGNDAWNCGHIDNLQSDESCDCHVCKDKLPLLSSSYPIRALVRHVSMSQFGHFMMGHARVHGHTLTLSGSYGSDGLPDTVPTKVYEYGTQLPDELYKAWSNSGGWNGAGSEASAMREWALTNLKLLRR